jgi:hypothetical protein
VSSGMFFICFLFLIFYLFIIIDCPCVLFFLFQVHADDIQSARWFLHFHAVDDAGRSSRQRRLFRGRKSGMADYRELKCLPLPLMFLFYASWFLFHCLVPPFFFIPLLLNLFVRHYRYHNRHRHHYSLPCWSLVLICLSSLVCALPSPLFICV